MKKKLLDWQIVAVLAAVAAVAVFVLYETGYIGGSRNEELGITAEAGGHISYETGPAVESALECLTHPDEREPADILTGYEASQRKVSLVFSGFSTPAEMESIQKLLAEYEMKAAFMLDGAAASETADTVQQLKQAGHIIGNYGFDAEKHWENLQSVDLAVSLAKNQAILRTITDSTPVFFQGNATEYTPEVLRVAACAELKTAIQPTTFVNDSSFNNFSAALGYVSKLDRGEIICVKIDDILDEIEYEPFEQDERPEKDKEGSLDVTQEETRPQEADIVTTVEYLLEALDTTETAVVPLDRLAVEPDPDVEKLFADRENAADYEVEESKAVGRNYFDDALFIGDSLTLTLRQYPSISKRATICAHKSISPMQYVNNMVVKDDEGNEIAVFDEIKSASPSKIYVLLGTNTLASGSNESLLVYYGRLVEMLQEQFPDAILYIQGLPPVTKAVASERITLSNGRIRKINVELAKLAKEHDCYYIDLYRAFADKEGNLPTRIAQKDGIHFKQRGCRIWIDYLAKHTAEQ